MTSHMRNFDSPRSDQTPTDNDDDRAPSRSPAAFNGSPKSANEASQPSISAHVAQLFHRVRSVAEGNRGLERGKEPPAVFVVKIYDTSMDYTMAPGPSWFRQFNLEPNFYQRELVFYVVVRPILAVGAPR